MSLVLFQPRMVLLLLPVTAFKHTPKTVAQSIQTLSNFILLKVLLGWGGLKRVGQVLARQNSSMSSNTHKTRFLMNLCSFINFHAPTMYQLNNIFHCLLHIPITTTPTHQSFSSNTRPKHSKVIRERCIQTDCIKPVFNRKSGWKTWICFYNANTHTENYRSKESLNHALWHRIFHDSSVFSLQKKFLKRKLFTG